MVHHRAVRFRFYQEHADTQWAVGNIYIGPACVNHCGGHGDCIDQHCLCDPGFAGQNCYANSVLKVKLVYSTVFTPTTHKQACKYLYLQLFVLFFQGTLKENFEWQGSHGSQWQILEGGHPCTDCRPLVEGKAFYFSGTNTRQAVTTDLDLRGAKSVLQLFYNKLF